MPETGLSAPRILLVEGERALAEPLARALGRAGYATTTVVSGACALELATRRRFDLVLLDATLPDADGREVCEALHERTDTPVVMLADSVGEADRAAWNDGAEDYIVKPVRGAEAVARVRGVLRRAGTGANGGAGGREVLRAGPLVLDTLLQHVRLDDRELRLPPKEVALLARLMREAGRPVSREALMHDVWGEEASAASRTLDSHVATLRNRLGDDPDAPRFIHTVRGVGFRFSAPEELRAAAGGTRTRSVSVRRRKRAAAARHEGSFGRARRDGAQPGEPSAKRPPTAGEELAKPQRQARSPRRDARPAR